jgi:hypothetical protein
MIESIRAESELVNHLNVLGNTRLSLKMRHHFAKHHRIPNRETIDLWWSWTGGISSDYDLDPRPNENVNDAIWSELNNLGFLCN